VSAPQHGLNTKQLALDLMAYIVDFWSNATDAEPLPERQVIAAGEVQLIAQDCAQLVLSLTGIDMDVPGSSPGPMQVEQLITNSLRHALFTVQLMRCAPTSDDDGEPPTQEQITACGLTAIRDAGLLSQALFQWCSSITTAGNTGVLHFGGGILATGGVVIPTGPNGGLVGIEGTVTVSAALLV